MNSTEVWKDERNLDDSLPFDDIEDLVDEVIIKLRGLIIEKNDLIEELMNENQSYRATIDRMNDYISEYEVAIRRFNEANAD